MLDPEKMKTVPESADLAIRFIDVSKAYRLFNSMRDQAISVLGLNLPFMGNVNSKEFKALQNINLEIGRGEQVGLIGRNGAGKTSLLKLLTGNFEPSSGEVVVNGDVQALMQTGLGFYPDFTGYENLRSSLLYNGIKGDELEAAIAETTEFVELGDFLNQPFKTYSLGMRSRLQFAAATAIKPDILIVDEVLGAGDAYFSGKSAARMKKLTSSGCTLLLVSHSMQQILQFCTRCVWIEAGKVVMDGAALSVVRAYEEYTRRLEEEAELARLNGGGSVLTDDKLRGRLVDTVKVRSAEADSDSVELNTTEVSRWPTPERGLKISRIRLLNSEGAPTRLLRSGEAASFELELLADADLDGDVRVAIVIYREDGFIATRLISEYLRLKALKGKNVKVAAKLDDTQLGGSRYSISASIYKEFDLNAANASVAYDLISRCFEFRVLPPTSDDVSLFHQRQEWSVVNDG